MNYDKFCQKMNEAGDAYVYYRSTVSNKQKYHICTMELFDGNKYIADKLAKRSLSIPKPGQVKVFCWDLDDFKNIDVSQVVSVVPLSSALR